MSHVARLRADAARADAAFAALQRAAEANLREIQRRNMAEAIKSSKRILAWPSRPAPASVRP